jgi:hypothetical protein
MAVMVTMTLKTDAATYQSVHAGLINLAGSAGLLFHSGHEIPGGIAVVDFWPSAEAFQKFMDGPAGEGLKASGIAQPDDVRITPVLTASKG